MGSGKGMARRARSGVVGPEPRSDMIVFGDGTKVWQDEHERPHRLDGPAVENSDGSKEWWVNGKRHRDDGPSFEGEEGLKAWRKNGKLHRLDGPAVERPDGSEEWRQDDLLHREDGPAIINSDGVEEWWWRGVETDQETVGENVLVARLDMVVLDTPEKVTF